MKTTGLVIFAHALIIAALLYFQTPQPKLLSHHPIAVQTYVVQEEKPGQTMQPKLQPKPTIKSKPKPKAPSKPRQVVRSDPNREKLVHMMQQSLASLDNPANEPKAPKAQRIEALSCEALSFKTAYQDQLIAFLENALTLPEKGDIEILLTLDRSGVIKALFVKKTSSERNRTYVESTIPALLLPSFENNFKGKSAHTFSITLTSS